MTRTLYLNGRKHVRKITRGEALFTAPYTVRITFAYRGMTGEWPVITAYEMRSN